MARKPKQKNDQIDPRTAMGAPPSASAEEPPFEPTGSYDPAQAAPLPTNQEVRGRFRSWITDTQRGYCRLTDEDRQRIVLLFDQKPADDVRAAMKSAGFHFEPDYHGHKNAWVRRNDHEGRLKAEEIERIFRGRTADQEVLPR